MPLTAIPQGVEIRKLSVAQKRALDELLGKETQGNLLQNAVLVGIPSILVGGIAFSFLFKDKLSELLPKFEDYIEQIPEATYSSIVGQGFDLGKTLTGVDLSAPTEATTGTIFENQTICERYGYDLVTLYAKKTNLITAPIVGLQIQQKLKGMKRNGCTKPPYVNSKNWNRA